MKNLLLLTLAIFAFSCSKDDDPIQLTQAEQEQINSFLVGTWEDRGYVSSDPNFENSYPHCVFTEDFKFYEKFIDKDTGADGFISVDYGIVYSIEKINDKRYLLVVRSYINESSREYFYRDLKITGDNNITLSPYHYAVKAKLNWPSYNLFRIIP